MTELLANYHGWVLSLGALSVLMITQFLILDFISIRLKQVPGMPITDGHDSLLFRAARVHANSNESLPSFLLISAFAIAVQANPEWLNALSIVFVIARVGHMVFYYMNYSVLRSISFGIGLVAMIGILAAGLVALA